MNFFSSYFLIFLLNKILFYIFYNILKPERVMHTYIIFSINFVSLPIHIVVCKNLSPFDESML